MKENMYRGYYGIELEKHGNVLSSVAKSFLRSVLKVESDERPSIELLLKHPFLADQSVDRIDLGLDKLALETEKKK